MKPNEAPEKIYLDPALDALTKALSEKTEDDVEYTRTDALIEKAIGWIDYNNRNGGCNFDGWEKDFRKAMKGGEK